MLKLDRFMRSKLQKIKRNSGMTYVELIVVLAIFGIMSSVVLFNYRDFQEKMEIKKLANLIALQLVQAQKSAIAGDLASGAIPDWKPSYGLSFNTSSSGPLTSFTYFTDLDNNGNPTSNETFPDTVITKGNYISSIILGSDSLFNNNIIPDPFNVVFRRPSTEALFYAGTNKIPGTSLDITISSPGGHSANIKVYTSGKIEID